MDEGQVNIYGGVVAGVVPVVRVIRRGHLRTHPLCWRVRRLSGVPSSIVNPKKDRMERLALADVIPDMASPRFTAHPISTMQRVIY